MAILASLHRPAGYSYNRKKRTEDQPEVTAGVPAPSPVVAAKRAPGRMPQSTEDQIVATNNKRRAQQEEEDYSRGQQYKRNLSMIHARNRYDAKTNPVSRAQDRENLKQLTARPPRDRGADAAGTRARAIVPLVAAPQSSPTMGLLTAQPQAPTAPLRDAIAPGPETTAASPASAPAASAQPRMPTAAEYIDSDTNEMQGRAKALAASAARGSTPQQDAAMGEANAIFARSPYARQADADQAAVAAMPQTNFTSPRPTATPPLYAQTPEAVRYRTLEAEAQRGQAAIDTGRSLEQQQADKELADERQFAIDATTAANPPRPATTAGYRPEQGLNRLPVHLQVRYQAALAKLQKISPTVYDAESGRDVPNPQYEAASKEIADIEKYMAAGEGGGEAAPEALPMNAGKVDVAKLKNGGIYTNPKGERAKWNAQTGKFESI